MQEQLEQGELLPVYRLTDGVHQNMLRQVMRRIVMEHAELVPESMPSAIVETSHVWPIARALKGIHVPRTQRELDQARRRFVFQEFLTMQLALGMQRAGQQQDSSAPSLPVDSRIDGRIERLLPFPLTSDQRRVVGEIAGDLARDTPMHRLLHGEVGSGKTIVAVYAMLVAVAHRYQAALMAPTEVLARQHLLTLQRLLAASQVRIQLLTGGMTTKERAVANESIAAGEVDLIVGTQAIVLGDITFDRLALVVIDEQHKFGVRQRATLKQASLAPHYLVMTATPIPRTIAMSWYGDLDVSTLREGPPGRQPVHTYWGQEEQRDRWWNFFAKKLRSGRQGYVIAPRVDHETVRQADDEETFDRAEPATVEQMYERLVNGPLEAFRVDLVHGRMAPLEKEGAMERFRSGKTQVLVATSVVEVGIDVPNANLMTIENAERFGLAQLHQLRGRVARGPFPGYVCAFTGDLNEEGTERMEAFVDTTNGFELAEIDLRLRGPGDLFGTKQHGLPPFRMADLQQDEAILREARTLARSVIEVDPRLDDPAYERLRTMLLRRYGETLELAWVG